MFFNQHIDKFSKPTDFKLFVFFLYFFLNLNNSQFLTSQTIILKIKGDSIYHKIINKSIYSVKNKEEQSKLINDIILKLNLEGYILAKVDSAVNFNDTSCYYINSHSYYDLLSLTIADNEILPINKPNTGSKNWVKQWKIYILQLLNYYQNNGFPFASIQLKPNKIGDSGINADLIIRKNEYIVFDTFDIVGNAQVSKKYIEKYLSIIHNKPYNEQLVSEIDKKLNELSWIEVVKPSEVYFLGNKALIRLYINNRQAGSFDAILGLAPSSDLNNQKLLLTGEAHLKLPNLLNKGYGLELDYNSYRVSSREIKARVNIPYLLGTSLGADLSFNLVKFDSLYIEVNSDIGLVYQKNANSQIKLYYKNQNVTLLQFDTQEIILTKKLPNYNDISNKKYGLYLKHNQLDYSKNPRKGWYLDFDISIGTKKIIEVEGLKQLGIYNSINLKSYQYQFTFLSKTYVPISKNIVWHTQIKSSQVYSPQLFFNDLNRIGGIKSLKGFDEQSIFASAYVIGNIELRYLFAINSNALIFANGGWWENNSLNIYKNGKPLGIGIGSNIETKSGIFSIYYALGKDIGNKFILKNGKVHFGFISYF